MKQINATNKIHCAIINVFVLCLGLTPLKSFSQTSRNTPAEIVKDYFELFVAMTPTDFKGESQDLEDLQLGLIKQSMELLCVNDIPLSMDKTEITDSIINGNLVVTERSIMYFIKHTDIYTTTTTLYQPIHNRCVRIGKWAETWYKTYYTSHTYNAVEYEYFYDMLIETIRILNGKARASYIEQIQLSLFYNLQVSGVNIIDYAILDDKNLAIVEVYQSNGTFFVSQDIRLGDKSSSYILLRKIGSRWYIDVTDNCHKDDAEVSADAQELKSYIEEYERIISSRPKAETSILNTSDPLPNPEDFDKFIIAFYKDTLFQKERVRFPIGGVYDFMSDSIVPYTTETWEHITGYSVHKISETQYGGDWATDGGYSGGSILFELNKNNKWYLTKFKTY